MLPRIIALPAQVETAVNSKHKLYLVGLCGNFFEDIRDYLGDLIFKQNNQAYQYHNDQDDFYRSQSVLFRQKLPEIFQ